MMVCMKNMVLSVCGRQNEGKGKALSGGGKDEFAHRTDHEQ